MLPTNNLIDNKKILVVDDDIILCESLEMGLSRKGANVIIANDGDIGIQKFHTCNPDLVIMDIRMPSMDGWEASRVMRLISDTPIIMLTSVSKDHEIVQGLTIGADDYVTKPFSHDVLMARINTVLRRYEKTEVVTQRQYDDGYLSIDLDSRNVALSGMEVKLTSTEYRLLAYLYEHAGKRLPYDAILNAVWGPGEQGHLQYVHVYVSRVRTKIEQDPKNPLYIVTEYGYGYGFKKRDGG